MRALEPSTAGVVDRDGVDVHYEIYGDAGPTTLLVPPWSIVHSRVWKMQIPYLARHGRVVVFDPRGNGRSGRPPTPDAYAETELAADALAVLDATSTAEASVVTLSIGAQRTLLLASAHPSRVTGIVFISPTVPLVSRRPERRFHFEDELGTDEGWAKFNAHYWRRDYEGFVRFFIAQCATEPHSTKVIEDGVAWGMQTDAETLIATNLGATLDEAATREICASVECPVLVIHGKEDRISPPEVGIALAAATHGRLVLIEGGGHLPNVRDPVKVNLLLRAFMKTVTSGRR